jgi:hypothetical protein
MNMFMIALALLMAVFSYFYPHFKVKAFHYSFILWLVIAFIRWSIYRKYAYLIFNNKPALSVNENFIYDFARDIKYDWDDIDEIYEDNGYLVIKLSRPIEYLARIKNPVQRFIKRIFSGNDASWLEYTINIDMVKVNPDALLRILNDYSLEA